MIIVYHLLFKYQFLKLAHRLEIGCDIGHLYSREGRKGREVDWEGGMVELRVKGLEK